MKLSYLSENTNWSELVRQVGGVGEKRAKRSYIAKICRDAIEKAGWQATIDPGMIGDVGFVHITGPRLKTEPEGLHDIDEFEGGQLQLLVYFNFQNGEAWTMHNGNDNMSGKIDIARVDDPELANKIAALIGLLHG